MQGKGCGYPQGLCQGRDKDCRTTRGVVFKLEKADLAVSVEEIPVQTQKYLDVTKIHATSNSKQY